MYAVIRTGGKQYKVAKDETVVVEKLDGEAGATVAFDQVLMVGDGESSTVGMPLVAGATVTAEIVEQGRGPKIIVFKKKRRKNHRRRNGHRQDLTTLRITEILTGGKKPAKGKAAPKSKAKAEAAGEPEAKEAPKPKAEAKAAEDTPKAKPKAEAKAAEDKPKAAPKKKPAKKPAAKKDEE